MTRAAYFPAIAAGLVVALLLGIPSAQAVNARGLDFVAYLTIQRGMTEGDVLAAAGKPDLVADQGFAPETMMVVYDASFSPHVERLTLIVRTYTYLATPEEPYTTTITFIGGRVNEIERNRKF